MEFIDHTGHIFSLPDYSQLPVGYEYSENPYVFWLSDDYSSNLSIDCFYLKPIYIVTDEQNISKITVECSKTNNYTLLKFSTIQERLKKSGMFDNGDKIDWSKASFELEFFTDEAKDLINNRKDNLAEGIETENTDGDFNQFFDLTKDQIDNIISESYYFTGIDGKDYDILNEQLIYDGYSEGALNSNNLSVKVNDFKTTELKSDIYDRYEDYDKSQDNQWNKNYTNASFNLIGDSVSNIVYINDDNVPVSKEEFQEIMTQQYYNYVHNFITVKKGEDVSNKKEEINTYLQKYQQAHIRTVYSKQTKYKMIPFYVLGNVKEPGVWMTNLLITMYLGNRNIYCPITVGGTYVDEQEELIINGKNMGIDLPKDICRALYNISFWNEVPDMSLWNQKIKEYLLNYMKLKGERGNFQSAIQALKWFGYGNKLSLSALIQTDNQVINQYICDNFDLNFDVINEFRYFRYSTLLSLSMPGIIEDPSGETNKFNWDNEFWGEGKPKLLDRFSEYIEPKKYDEGYQDFLRPYYDWTFNEIGLKLCALKYYYKKYFLPIHLSIHRASITNQCFANDVKMLNIASNLITEKSFFAGDDKFFVKFSDSNIVWLEDISGMNISIDPDTWIFDSHLSDKIDYLDDVYYIINDNCFCVDINFVLKNFIEGDEHIFYCKMFSYQNDNLMLSSDFTIFSKEENYNIRFIIYPKHFNKNFDVNFWLDKDYIIKLMVNGIWFEYKFKLKIPELDIELGKLEYRYDYNIIKQFSGFENNAPKFNANMYLPDLVSVNNINFYNELFNHIEDNNLKIVDKKLLDNQLYYYTINEQKEKIILCTGSKTLVEHNKKYYLVPNPYYSDINNIKSKNGFNFVSNESEFKDNLVNIIESNTKIYSSICKNINSLIDLYSIHGNIPDNPYLMNKVYIFKLFKKNYETDESGNIVDYNKYEYQQVKYDVETYSSGNDFEIENAKFFNYIYGHDTERDEKLDRKSEFLKIEYDNAKFGDNDTEEVKNLYLKFFDENGDWVKPLEYFNATNESSEWKEEKDIKQYFDLFLMHDYDNKNYQGYWYVILISKNTIGSSDVDLDNIIDKTKFYRTGFDWDYNNEYYIQYDRSDEKFLINRMNFSKMNGVYHFRTNDTIVARLNNFNNIPHKLKIGSRWSFTPLALGTTYKKYYDSPTNIGLMSIGEGVNKAERGYYKVEVKYSVDNFVNETQKRTTKLLIDDSLPIVEGIQDDVYIPVKPFNPTIPEIPDTPTQPDIPENKALPEILYDVICIKGENKNKTEDTFMTYNCQFKKVGHEGGYCNIDDEYKLIFRLNNPPYEGYKFTMNYDVVENGIVKYKTQTLSKFEFTLKINDERNLYLQRTENEKSIEYFIHFNIIEDDYFYSLNDRQLNIMYLYK